jgi:adenine-specific DNA methylase
MDRRLIEEYFPVKEVSIESSKDKSTRQGHISTFHIWWARRPLAASRAINYAALRHYGENHDLEDEKYFIEKISKWKNSTDEKIIGDIKKRILQNKVHPKILDPFSGGGAIPLEAYRLGCEVYAGDYNPVSTFILKCLLEYPIQYIDKDNGFSQSTDIKLLNDIKKWSKWVFDSAQSEISKFYTLPDVQKIIGFKWIRITRCKNPICKREFPLLKNFWLSNSEHKKIALFLKKNSSKLEFSIVGNGHEKFPNSYDPSKGTITNNTPTCPYCNMSEESEMLRNDMFEEKIREECIVAIVEQQNSKQFKIMNTKNHTLQHDVGLYLTEKQHKFKTTFGYDPIPFEFIDTPNKIEYKPGGLYWVTAGVVLYGITKWSDFFNDRQKLAIVTFMEKIKLAYLEMIKQGVEKKYARVITSYLAIILDRLLDRNSKLSLFIPGNETIGNTLSDKRYSIVWDYFELNPFGSLGWNSLINWPLMVLEHISKIKTKDSPVPFVYNSSALKLPFQNNFFDCVLTDPPYYDMVSYSVLFDFFYVWLRRCIGDLYPDLFTTPVSPKSNEIIQNLSNLRGMKKSLVNDTIGIKTDDFFEKNLSHAFLEIHRVLKESGIAVIVYAHSSTIGWEKCIHSILNSGLTITGSWPIHTERKSRKNALENATLASSIYMVARKWKKQSFGFYREIKVELKQYLNKKLDKLWTDGISGGDFFISAIGSAIEIFGKYEKIVDDSDNVIPVLKLLDDTREIATNYAIKKVLNSEFSDQISQMTRFYILWRWAYGEAPIIFDDARKITQTIGIDLEHEWNKGFIIKDDKYIRILGPHERNENIANSHELIDILHLALLLWKNKKKDSLEKLLKEKGYDKSDMFKRVGQAISQSLPKESTEKKWLDGFLTGFRTDDSQTAVQTKLF